MRYPSSGRRLALIAPDSPSLCAIRRLHHLGRLWRAPIRRNNGERGRGRCAVTAHRPADIGERTDGPVFLAARGRRLDRHGAGRIVRKVARRAGIAKAVTPHTLRHAFITAA
jgi:integrase